MREYVREAMVECRHENGVVTYVPEKLFAEVVMRLKRNDQKYVTFREGAEIYRMSERLFHDLAKAAGAISYFNTKAIIRVDKIDQYLEYCRDKS